MQIISAHLAFELGQPFDKQNLSVPIETKMKWISASRRDQRAKDVDYLVDRKSVV